MSRASLVNYLKKRVNVENGLSNALSKTILITEWNMLTPKIVTLLNEAHVPGLYLIVVSGEIIQESAALISATITYNSMSVGNQELTLEPFNKQPSNSVIEPQSKFIFSSGLSEVIVSLTPAGDPGLLNVFVSVVKL